MIATLPRQFIIKGLVVPDPNPNASLDEVLELLTQDHPSLRHTKIYGSDAKLSDDKQHLCYEIVFPPVKTDG